MQQGHPFIDHYHARVACGDITSDAGQEKAAQAFDALYTALRRGQSSLKKRRWFGRNSSPLKGESTRPLSASVGGTSGDLNAIHLPPTEQQRTLKKSSLFPLPLRGGATTPAATTGLYIWGDVGRGKSMLMDLFVETIAPFIPTQRAHFHAFMRNVHHRLFGFRRLRVADPIPRVVDEIAHECRILCLDEMQVHDVADAMILSRLFSGLMDAGVCVVFTSNRPPSALYQGGLQREQFVAFIAMLEARLPIVHLDSAVDYRLVQQRAVERSYVFPLSGEADDFLLAAWARLTGDAPSDPLRIEVDGRTLRVDKYAKGVAWLTFDELCLRPLGAGDYLELIKPIHTLILQGIPALKAEDRNAAKRFVTLIDTLYDHRIKLIATAATAAEDVYAHGDGSFEFTRTTSRLIEMQSDAYWGQALV